MKLNKVNHVQLPKFDEISVKNLYPKLIILEGVAEYFPTTYPKGWLCDRSYLFNIANTIHPDIVKEVIDYALSQRFGVNDDS